MGEEDGLYLTRDEIRAVLLPYAPDARDWETLADINMPILASSAVRGVATWLRNNHAQALIVISNIVYSRVH